ncbi:hypothetical protein BXT84_14265 [Sulfobacillus thermotolerans]|uniref:HTH gntR-type domain-containing protein n=1 Tax=Sulfobacillus thermotolerans TaxID=338644 RepID=A0ABM6RUV4_9FIRM|nr:hypothetical protein BXT84_14265 [Sulfobacillus thermotolerans]
MTSRFVPRQRLARESIEALLSTMSAGSKLPSEEQLAKQLGISRPTIRSALSALEQEGLIVRRHGVGTFASTPHTDMDASLQVLNSVADIVRNNGYTPAVTDVHITSVSLPTAVCDALLLPTASPGFRVVRTVTADGQPAVFLVDYLPETIGKISVDLSVFSDKMIAALAHLGVFILYARTHLSIQRSTAEAAEALNIATGDPVLYLQQVAYTTDHTPAIYSIGYHREGVITYTLTRYADVSERAEP